MTLKDHEKFLAFIALLLSILGLVFLASTFDRGLSNDIVVQGKLRIIDSSIAGLLTIAGMCAQALFKIGTGETVHIGNKKDDPVPTEPVPAPETVDEELPDYAK